MPFEPHRAFVSPQLLVPCAALVDTLSFPNEMVCLGSVELDSAPDIEPALTLDGDGVQDLADICPFTPDAPQLNRGSFLDAADESDRLGDACQCAGGRPVTRRTIAGGPWRTSDTGRWRPCTPPTRVRVTCVSLKSGQDGGLVPRLIHLKVYLSANHHTR